MGKSKVGLSGIREQAQGFVGSWVKKDETQGHVKRIRFDLGCGKPDENRGKLVTWRHCIAYGKVADKLNEIKQGDLVNVTGWVTTERTSHVDEPLTKKEYLVLFDGALVDKSKLSGHVKQFELSFTAG